jgi:vancomycin resistance protein YoaR
MTTTDTVPPAQVERRRSARLKFLVAFLTSLIVALALGAGAIYAYDQQYQGKVLPGVRVGEVDLGGLDREAARARLVQAYASLGSGRVIISNSIATFTLDYATLGRRADVDSMLEAAFAAGRTGTTLENAVSGARLALKGAVVQPTVIFDQAALEDQVRRLASRYVRAPASASIELTKEGFVAQPARWGRVVDANALMKSVATSIADVAAPSQLAVPLELKPIAPTIDNVEAMIARTSAERMVGDLRITDGKDDWTIKAATVRSWIGFDATADGLYVPSVDSAAITKAVKGLAKKIDRKPKNAAFLVGRNGAIVGVTAGHNGRALDVGATAAHVETTLQERAKGLATKPVRAQLRSVTPNLTTAEAEKSAPLMKRISTWTTWFPIGEKNNFGANIWVPARLINGYVVGPGETFDFWKAVGPVTRAKGFGLGGAIINGRTEPQGALAGGICSCSTTLFNAAIRAGFKMGARRNHYYYIDRYPIGLDATVFISAGGSAQTMSFTNDTANPVLIRGINTRSGGRGFVRFDLYSVPTGRKVTFSRPIIRNVRPAWDSVQSTSSMKAGTSKRIEYPVDGKDVWVTRTVRENGRIIHQETLYSHYARITGIVLVGRG